ncbi:FadR family transcriptional regulator [Neobacillus notoginsengisoli]|uniref:FadR family transcriptional regulator n=1 Tax=Neobacillus notoginsengisoli TaxID=1578198 RepID=A0A417YFD3_9BACI|nr:FadR/GntR family transcriptional regulator [Neobacillus notoginsengisoli]RHW31428.1 FadR family transcriptional regulator [Neobacillus notoginsengisoli]
MEYKKIKPKKIYEEVAEAIHEMIRSGKIKPGERLDSVQQLAENFHVGRSAIREALSALKAMGLVEMRQGEGTFVKEFDASQVSFPLSTAILMNKDDIRNLLELRKIIEGGTAAAAAVRRTPSQLMNIEKALEEMKTAHGNEELGEKADYHFHLAIAGAAQNPLLTGLMEQVSNLMVETMKETRRVWLFSKETTTDRLYEEHLRIYRAIQSQNSDEARQAMLTHLENVEEILDKYLESAPSY